jgi:hypothetical protein
MWENSDPRIMTWLQKIPSEACLASVLFTPDKGHSLSFAMDREPYMKGVPFIDASCNEHCCVQIILFETLISNVA